jgi:hypothetical protein
MPPLLISKKRCFTTKHNTTTTTTTKDPNYYQVSSTLPSYQGKEKTQEERERDQETNQTKPTKPTTQKQNPNPIQEETFQVLYTTNNSQSSTQPGLWRRWVLLLWRVSRGREGGVRSDSSLVFCELQRPAVLPDSSIFVCSAAT